MSDTVRSFIAIELNEKIHFELASLQNILKSADADVKWVAPESIHLTMKFLGNLTAEKLEETKKIIAETAANAGPFTLTLKGVGAFPKLDYPRVIWVGITDGVAETVKLAMAIEDKLEKIGVPRENREFHPHLTLGRVRSLKNKDKLKEIIETTKFEARTASEANNLILFKSQLTREGPIYTPLFIAKMKNA